LRLTRNVRLGAVMVVLVLATLALPRPQQAGAAPPDVVADTPAEYGLCGRVFPDPMAYGPAPTAAPFESPWAKGNAVCRATDFISYDAAIRGLEFLEERFPRFVEVLDLTDPQFDEVLNRELGDGQSAGLQSETLEREKANLVMVKVTDDESPIAEEDRAHFVFPLSIHGIERAGVEGGLRAVEDLATWGTFEPNRPIMETITDPGQLPKGTENLPVGEVLERTASYFVLANPDGWRRGDTDAQGGAFMRFNGNGVDLNREWPTVGYTDLSYTPWSEPESRSFGRALQSIKPKWAGGIDLHGQIIDRAFSFTLIGGAQRTYPKNERVMQFVEQAYADASARLSWSKLIKPNDALPGCVESNNLNPEVNPPPCDPRVYGVQYGTIWDSISYTVTGDFGSWIDSPLGLNGDGIDNEMSMSHLGNCGSGKCYIPDAEQLHVDGNKSLVYSMLNFQIQPPSSHFEFQGKAAFLYNPRRLVDPGTPAPTPPAGTRPQATITRVIDHRGGESTFEFQVKGPAQGFYNGGISARVDFSNIRGISQGLHSVHIDRLRANGEWDEIGEGFGTGTGYNPAGQKVDVNYQPAGTYRFRVDGPTPAQVNVEVDFTTAPAWPDPVERPFNVSNMDFFTSLSHYTDPGQLTALPIKDVLDGTARMWRFDTIIAADDAFLPGFEPTSKTKQMLPGGWRQASDRNKMAGRMRTYAQNGGNLVLTDDSLRALEWMRLVPADSVDMTEVYAGNVSFTLDGLNNTYDDPLAANMNPSGSSEGPGIRKQIAEPVPLGYALGDEQEEGDGGEMPEWYVDRTAFEEAGGRVVGIEGPCSGFTGCLPGQPSDDVGRVVLGELPIGEGRIRVLGSFAPWPTTEFSHNYGLSSYAVTFNGYELAKNLFSWKRPG
ncbi:MAG: M14 family zinc carboxypeptidase, partial [Actinomycetota bacterium]